MVRIFQRDLIGVTLQTSLLMSAFMFSYYSITYWYPTFLIENQLNPLRYVIAFSIGAILGTAMWGRASDTRLGRRGAVSMAALIGVTSLPIYLVESNTSLLWVGTLVMGVTGASIWGMAPSYLTERFPTAVRGVGPGLVYHVGAAIGSMTPLALGQLQDGGMAMGRAMTLCIAVSGLLVATMIWMGPETRGRTFTAPDDEAQERRVVVESAMSAET